MSNYDVYAANRRFEMMFPGIAYQEHLRTTDPERYEEHMRGLANQPLDLEGSEILETIVINLDKRTVKSYSLEEYRTLLGQELVSVLKHILEKRS